MVLITLNDWVWLEANRGDFEVEVGAQVLKVDGDSYYVLDDDKNEMWIRPPSKVKVMHPSSASGVADMIQLGDLNEAGILRNLLIRYRNEDIYTYTGSILVALNPYKVLPIYSTEHTQMYKDKKMGEMPPHIFAVADNSYHNMLRYQDNQCVIISGESGAGKTESTKLILQYLAAVSGQHSWVEQQILEANPVMEAFGNAKTVRNDNSSRFGKYIEIVFDNNGVIQGASIEQYLLEKSRIIAQNENERNYHIFYCMVAGLNDEEKNKMHLTSAEDFFYLTQGNCVTCEGRDDKQEFYDIRSAMQVLLFTDEDITHTTRILAALLHLGNVTYKACMVNNMEGAEVQGKESVSYACELLGLNDAELNVAMVTKTISTRGESVRTSLRTENCVDVRDAFVKGVYSRLFVWLIDGINKAIKKEGSKQGRNSIGVLDIFGFENFNKNSFEQLCINYANENLQQFFVQHIFKLEQEEYDQEGINWSRIEFIDNQEVLDLIAQQPLNLFALVDEESKFPKGSDVTLLSKLNKNHGKNPNYSAAKSDTNKHFLINHFAGTVAYDVIGFLEKNRDTFSSDFLILLQHSKLPFLTSLFKQDFTMLQDSRKRSQTLGSQFKRSLELLMKTLGKCQPFFVRCIKPNEFKKAMETDRGLITRQLRYSGMMETIAIRKRGYPIRHSFEHFVDRYRVLLSGVGPSSQVDCREASERICEHVLKDEDFQLGKNKVFLKDAHDCFLEQERDRVLTFKIVTIQRCLKTWVQRSKFKKTMASCVVVQKFIRAYQAKKNYQRVRHGYSRLQALVRSRALAQQFGGLRRKMIAFQRHCTGYFFSHIYTKKLQSVVVLQAAVRELISKRQYYRVRFQAKKERESENLMAADVKRLEKSMGKAEARKEAERLHQERLARISEEMATEESQMREDILMKKHRIDDASNRMMQTVNDSQVINEMFDINDDQYDKIGTAANSYMNFEPIDSKSLETTDDTKLPLPDDLDEDIMDYKFNKFAATFFQNNATPTFVKKALKYPLLPHESEGDQIAALSVWITILRFMQDLPDAKEIAYDKDNTPVMSKIYTTLGRKFNKKDVEDIQKMGSEIETNQTAGLHDGRRTLKASKKMVNMTLKKKSKINHLESDFIENLQTNGPNNAMLSDYKTSNLEKLHFIIGQAILRPELSDEIYCQICKQLSNNPSKPSLARGWILLSLCVGCFAPSEKFVKYLRCFIKEGPTGYAPFCEQRLLRTFANGPRKQPPSWMELQSTKSKKNLLLPVTFMDGSTKSLPADSATTSKELCQQLANKINLKDTFGFSLFIALFDKVSSLGSGTDHVMDAISQCEQYAKEKGAQERNAPWRLFFRKEIFAPWHDPSTDPIATDLIYQQVVRGVKFGEYRCEKEEEVVKLAAQQLFIEHGNNVSQQLVSTMVSQYIPDFAIGNNRTGPNPPSFSNSVSAWTSKILNYFNGARFNEKKTKESVKEEIVSYAQFKWPILFSRFYEAYKFAGPILPKNDVIIAVNWTGVYILNENEAILIEWSYSEITMVTCSRTSKTHGHSFNLGTLKGEEYTFTSPNAEDVRDLIVTFLEGLRKKSKYAIALQNYQPPNNDGGFLTLHKGDLITLKGTGEDVKGWCSGTAPSKEVGDFPAECVYVLPTITKPSQELLNLYAQQPSKNYAEQPDTKKDSSLHTLEDYSYDHFRQPPKKSISKSIATIRRRADECLWRQTTQPIKSPLLRKLVNDPALCSAAVDSFNVLLKYTGDLPTKQPVTDQQLQQFFFQPALINDSMKDEIYCQTIRQLTYNKNPTTEAVVWQVMNLLTGSFAPSTNLLKELKLFLQTRHSIPAAVTSLTKLEKTLKSGNRKQPPHRLEIEASRKNIPNVKQKINLLDDTHIDMEVESHTRGHDMCQTMAQLLKLKNADGFSIFIKIKDKILSVPEGDFFFDYVQHLTAWVNNQNNNYTPLTYQVLFMKKLWSNTVPGYDVIADCKFHYYQELPKVLKGYHKCSVDEAIKLASYVMAVKSNKQEISNMNSEQLLKECVPENLREDMSAQEWKQRLLGAYEETKNLPEKDAKVAFLKQVSYWPTFGSTFFSVKQSKDSSLPEKLIIAINKHGVNLIHPDTKDILVTHPFTKICNWSSGSTFFHIHIGSLIKGNKLLCETHLGYMMDDLLTSYIGLMLAAVTKQKTIRRK